MSERLPKWIKLERAIEISGHDTVAQLSDWCRRWNEDAANVDCIILRRRGLIERHSLISALERDARNFTAAESVRAGVAALHLRERGRGNGAHILDLKRQAHA